MKIKRLVFSDIDGTLYNFPDKKIHPNTKSDILNAIENDEIEFILTTGNPPIPKIQKLAYEFKSKYIICANGALIYDFTKNDFLFVSPIQVENVDKILQIVKNNHETAYFFGKQYNYLCCEDPDKKDFLNNFFEYTQ